MSLGVAGVADAELFIDLLAEDTMAVVGRVFPAKGSRSNRRTVLEGSRFRTWTIISQTALDQFYIKTITSESKH